MSEVEVAKITAVKLGGHDGPCGLLVFWIYFEFAGGGQGMGGYRLDGASSRESKIKAPGWGAWFNWLAQVFEILNVADWSELPGTMCRIKRDSVEFNASIIAIGHAYKDKWADIRDYQPSGNIFA